MHGLHLEQVKCDVDPLLLGHCDPPSDLLGLVRIRGAYERHGEHGGGDGAAAATKVITVDY